MKNKQPSSPPLKRVQPSGKKDDSFFDLVFEVVRQIPKGRVTSYGAIAAALGLKSSARMVGWALNSCHHVKPKVPAQRVVNRQGLLTGKIHFEYPEQMQELLQKDGVQVLNDQVVDFRERFWDPMTELS
jgi:methylated-DNA-protein-cysteine methyltransferase-like protein